MIEDLLQKFEPADFKRILHEQDQIIKFTKSTASLTELEAHVDNFLHTSLTQAKYSKAILFIKCGISHLDNLELYPTNVGVPELNSVRYSINHKSELLMALTRSISPVYLQTYKEILDIEEKTIQILKHCSDNPLLAPLLYKGNLSGLLVLGTHSEQVNYSNNNWYFLSNLCAVASITLENAKLHKFATEDSITKLKMRRIFDYYLQYYFIEIQSNSKLNISIILIDIDFFKQINDRFGHIYGDLVLYQVSQEIMKNLPTSSIASRYGGEEFGIILPKVDLEQTIQIGEKLRKSIENLKFYPEEAEYTRKEYLTPQKQLIPITISLGITQMYPKSDSNPQKIIKRCDDYLYQAKANGRNTVCSDLSSN